MRSEYNDQRLIQFLVEGELPLRRIAQRIGISLETVREIDAGTAREDLQDTINQALRQRLRKTRGQPAGWGDGAQASNSQEDPRTADTSTSGDTSSTGGESKPWRQRAPYISPDAPVDMPRPATTVEVGLLSTDERELLVPPAKPAEPSRDDDERNDNEDSDDHYASADGSAESASYPRKDYDEDLLVQLAAEGHSAKEVGQRVGLNADYARRIMGGRARKDVYRRIRDIVDDHREETRRLILHSLRTVAAKHIHEALHGTGETARKARQYILDAGLVKLDTARSAGHAEDKRSTGVDRIGGLVEPKVHDTVAAPKWRPEKIIPEDIPESMLCMTDDPCEYITAQYTMWGQEVPPYDPDHPETCCAPNPCEHARPAPPLVRRPADDDE